MSIVTEKTINQLDESSRDDEKDINEREVLKETKRLEMIQESGESNIEVKRGREGNEEDMH